jgi:plastocyanin
MSEFNRKENPFREPRPQTGRRLGLATLSLIALTLLIAACAPAADQATAPTAAPASSPVPTDTPSAETILVPAVTLSDQEIVDSNVSIAEVVSDGPGWLVIHAQADGKPGPILGYSPIADGVNADVTVQIDATSATETLYAMLHTDAGEIGAWEFPMGPDAPANQGDAIVMTPFALEIAEGAVEVAMSGFQFDPPLLLVKAGTTVTWIDNDGAVEHDVASDAGFWHSDLFAGGGSFDYTFDEPGVYPYHCDPHGDVGGAGMAGTIIVLN